MTRTNSNILFFIVFSPFYLFSLSALFFFFFTSTTTTTTTTTEAATTATEAVPEATAAETMPDYGFPVPPADWTAPQITLHRRDLPVQLALPEGVTPISWTSYNPGAVTVSDEGAVTAVGNGRTTIFCTADDGHLYNFHIAADIVEWEELGDLSGDGAVDAADANLVLQEFAKQIVLEEEYTVDNAVVLAADINEDSTLDAIDAALILNFYTRYGVLEISDDAEEVWLGLLDDMNILNFD